MRTRLSSSVTPLYRTFFPVLWIAGLGVSVGVLWLAPLDPPAPRWVAVVLTAVWIVGGILLVRLGRRLRDVWLDGDTLIVRGARGERRVPLRAVTGVRELHVPNPPIVWLRVRRSDRTQVRMPFVARWELRLPFSTHSDVRRLRERIGAAAGPR